MPCGQPRSNGIINVMPIFLSVFAHLENNEFSKFRELIEIAEMEEEIAEQFAPSENEDEPLVPAELITLFAPTNEAFDKLSEEQNTKLFGEGKVISPFFYIHRLLFKLQLTIYFQIICCVATCTYMVMLQFFIF